MEVSTLEPPKGIKGRREMRDAGLNVWPEVRCAYIETAQKPSFEELAQRFHVNLGTVRNTAAEEGWALQRSRFMDAMAVKADVSAGLIELARDRKETSGAVANAVLVGVRKLTFFAESIPDDSKPRAAMDLLGTFFFALANASKALKDAGLVEVPKELTDSLGKSGGKEFLKGALNQINITVQAAQSAQSAPIVMAEPQAAYSATPEAKPSQASEELPPE